MRGNNTSAKQAIGFVGDEFDETVRSVVDFASGDVRKRNEGGFIFTVAAGEVVFIKTDGNNSWVGVGQANKAVIVGGIFGFINEICGKDRAFVVGKLGRGIFAKAIADGVDILGGSFEIAVDDNARILVFDAGVFETKIESGLAAGGEDDAVGANHFFGAAIYENDALSGGVLFERDDFRTGENHYAKFAREVTCDSVADFFVFAGE